MQCEILEHRVSEPVTFHILAHYLYVIHTGRDEKVSRLMAASFHGHGLFSLYLLGRASHAGVGR